MKDFLILTFQGIAAFAALAAVIVTILLNWNRLRSNPIFNPIPPHNQKTFIFTTISRRNFLVVSGFATVIIFWTSIHFKLAKEKFKTIYNRLFQIDNGLIINKKTGVIHHNKLCSDHLPIDKNISDSNYPSSKIRCHKSKKVPILDIIAQTRSAEDALSQLLAEKKWGTKEHKKYLKALQHIQGQKEKALRNARNRAIVKCGPICLGETT